MRLAQQREEAAGQIGPAPFAAAGVLVEVPERVPLRARSIVGAGQVADRQPLDRGGALLADRLALAAGERGEEIVEGRIAVVAPVELRALRGSASPPPRTAAPGRARRRWRARTTARAGRSPPRSRRSARARRLASRSSSRGPGTGRERRGDLQLGVIVARPRAPTHRPRRGRRHIRPGCGSWHRRARSPTGAPSAPSTTIGIGCQPARAPTLPDSSSAARKAWPTNGLAVPAHASHSVGGDRGDAVGEAGGDGGHRRRSRRRQRAARRASAAPVQSLRRRSRSRLLPPRGTNEVGRSDRRPRTIASISTAAPSGSTGTPTARARMPARIAEQRDHQLGRAVGDLGLVGEVGGRIDEHAQLHDPLDPRRDRREPLHLRHHHQRRTRCAASCPSSRSTSSPSRPVTSVPSLERQLPRQMEQPARLDDGT